MKTPLEGGPWIELDSIDSTQLEAERRLKAGEALGILFAHHQVFGRGRFGRPWVSERDASLTCSLAFLNYADHPEPWLIGMAVACAAAGALHTKLQWPNDLLLHGRKVGGILTHLVDTPSGRVPLVGLGVNLNQESFPDEIAETAISLRQESGRAYDPETCAREILDALSRLPEPTSWAELQPVWSHFDETPGKRYKLWDGQVAMAVAVGHDARLVCSLDGETHTVSAAEAIFGPVMREPSSR